VLLVTCLTVVLFVADVPTEAVQTYLFSGLDNFPLLAVPFFVLAGEIMARGGIARRVVVWVMSLIGGVRGSLAVTTVAASELFGAMAHTAVGTVVAVGRMIYPSLKENGYNERSAVHRDDPLFGIGTAIRGGVVHGRSLAEPADRLGRCALRHAVRPHQGGATHL
jgi:C4-dicarboxylate transporter DctM subunit